MKTGVENLKTQSLYKYLSTCTLYTVANAQAYCNVYAFVRNKKYNFKCIKLPPFEVILYTVRQFCQITDRINKIHI